MEKIQLWKVSDVKTTLSPEDIQVLKGSGLARFDKEGKLTDLSPMATSAANFNNFGEDSELRDKIYNLSSRLEKDMLQPESLAEKALRGA